MVTRFAPHGQFKAYVDGRLIVSEVVGPWNRELVDQWAAALLPLARHLQASGPHVGLAVIRVSMLCPPDAFAAMQRALSYGTARLGSIGNVIVADAAVEGRALLASTYERLYDAAVPHRIFDELEPARAWALSLLAARGF